MVATSKTFHATHTLKQYFAVYHLSQQHRCRVINSDSSFARQWGLGKILKVSIDMNYTISMALAMFHLSGSNRDLLMALQDA